MVIIDTSVWIDYLRGEETPKTLWLDAELSRQRLGITDLILCEILQGVRDEAQAQETLGSLRLLEIFPVGGVEFAISVARNHRLLRDRGFTVRKTIDGWIAAFCIQNGHALLHEDRDFDPFERFLGLAVIHP